MLAVDQRATHEKLETIRYEYSTKKNTVCYHFDDLIRKLKDEMP